MAKCDVAFFYNLQFDLKFHHEIEVRMCTKFQMTNTTESKDRVIKDKT